MITVTAAIIRRNGKYLISKRRIEDTMGGFWEFPGGGVDEGETPDQGVARELREELGVEARPISLFDAAVGAEGHIVILFYRCETVGEGEPRPLDSEEIRWVRPSELKDYDFLPADTAVLDRLCSEDNG